MSNDVRYCFSVAPSTEDPTSLSGNEVGRVYEDSEGALWVATWDGGLSVLDRATGSGARLLCRARSRGSGDEPGAGQGGGKKDRPPQEEPLPEVQGVPGVVQGRMERAAVEQTGMS